MTFDLLDIESTKLCHFDYLEVRFLKKFIENVFTIVNVSLEAQKKKNMRQLNGCPVTTVNLNLSLATKALH